MQVSEDKKVGDTIGTVLATDADENPKIYYYIIGNHGLLHRASLYHVFTSIDMSVNSV